MKLWTRVKIWLAQHVAPHVMHHFTRSLKLEIRGREHYLSMRKSRGCILAFWHESFFMLPEIHKDEQVQIMVSKHSDGEMIHRALVRFGLSTVRGSSTTGGRAALDDLTIKGKDGLCLAITPDGPTGPRRQLKPGLIALAQRTGLPIVLIASGVRRAWVIQSWDRFVVPKPFSAARVIYSEPIWVPADLDDDAFEAMRLRVEQQLTAMSEDVAYDKGPSQP